MARIKNALTEHYVGEWVDAETSEADLRLAKWIREVTDDSDEEVEEEAYYDGDGTLSSDVTGISKTYTFEGMFDSEDEGHAFIASLEFEIGEGRKIFYKQIRTDGRTLSGPATVTEIVVTGGPAEEYATFECSISWDQKPEITGDDEGE